MKNLADYGTKPMVMEIILGFKSGFQERKKWKSSEEEDGRPQKKMQKPERILSVNIKYFFIVF